MNRAQLYAGTTTLTSADAHWLPCPTSVRAIGDASATRVSGQDAFVEILDLSRVLDPGFHVRHVRCSAPSTRPQDRVRRALFHESHETRRVPPGPVTHDRVHVAR